MNTSLSIKMKDVENKSIQKSITYVSDSVSSADLVSMAQGLTGLTTNTYLSADRIQKINVDTESIPSGGSSAKTDPTLTAGSKLSSDTGFNYTYNGDGDVYAYVNEDYAVLVNRTSKTVTVADIIGHTGIVEYTGTLYATEGASYAAKSVTFSYDDK